MAATQYQIFIRYLNENNGRVLTNQTTIEWIQSEELFELRKFYQENETQYNKWVADMNKPINPMHITDLTAYEASIYYKCKRYLEIQDHLDSKDGKYVEEHCKIRSYDTEGETGKTAALKKNAKSIDIDFYTYVIDETQAENPKYDMIFMYDGISHIEYPGWPKNWDKLTKEQKNKWMTKYENADESVTDLNPEPSCSHINPEIYYERMKRVKIDPWFLHSTHASLNSAMSKAKELVNLLGKNAVKIGKIVPLEQYIEIV